MLVSSVCTSLNKPVSETVVRTLIIKITYGIYIAFSLPLPHLALYLSFLLRPVRSLSSNVYGCVQQQNTILKH